MREHLPQSAAQNVATQPHKTQAQPQKNVQRERIQGNNSRRTTHTHKQHFRPEPDSRGADADRRAAHGWSSTWTIVLKTYAEDATVGVDAPGPMVF